MTTPTVERMLPLYEGKMLGAYDHRAADVVKSPTAEKRQNQPRYLTDLDKADPYREPLPLNWVREEVLPDDLPTWLIGFSDVTSATNERTVLAAALPRAGVGHTYPLIFGNSRHLILSMLNSLIFDFLARQKVAGLHLTYTYLKQIPLLTPGTFAAPCPWDKEVSLAEWITPRVEFLSCTSWSMVPMVESLDGHPLVYSWNPQKRFVIRAEIDAAMFHAYGVSRADAEYVMDTFTIARKYELADLGEYRTRRVVLEIFDATQTAIDTGIPYQAIVDLQPLAVSPTEGSTP